MANDKIGVDGLGFSPVDLLSKFNITSEQLKELRPPVVPVYSDVVQQQQQRWDAQAANISESIAAGKREFVEMQAKANAEEMAKAMRTPPNVYDKVISALSALCGDTHYNATASEDTMNDCVRNLIAASWEVRDQTRNGISGTSNSAEQERAGELDIQIRHNGKPICVYEGLKLDSVKRNDIHEHIAKATINYNPQGVKNIFVIAYVVNHATGFGDFWHRFCSCVKQYDAQDEEHRIDWDDEETDSGMSAIRVLHGIDKADGVDHDVYVIAVKIQS